MMSRYNAYSGSAHAQSVGQATGFKTAFEGPEGFDNYPQSDGNIHHVKPRLLLHRAPPGSPQLFAKKEQYGINNNNGNVTRSYSGNNTRWSAYGGNSNNEAARMSVKDSNRSMHSGTSGSKFTYGGRNNFDANKYSTCRTGTNNNTSRYGARTGTLSKIATSVTGSTNDTFSSTRPLTEEQQEKLERRRLWANMGNYGAAYYPTMSIDELMDKDPYLDINTQNRTLEARAKVFPDAIKTPKDYLPNGAFDPMSDCTNFPADFDRWLSLTSHVHKEFTYKALRGANRDPNTHALFVFVEYVSPRFNSLYHTRMLNNERSERLRTESKASAGAMLSGGTKVPDVELKARFIVRGSKMASDKNLLKMLEHVGRARDAKDIMEQMRLRRDSAKGIGKIAGFLFLACIVNGRFATEMCQFILDMSQVGPVGSSYSVTGTEEGTGTQEGSSVSVGGGGGGGADGNKGGMSGLGSDKEQGEDDEDKSVSTEKVTRTSAIRGIANSKNRIATRTPSGIRSHVTSSLPHIKLESTTKKSIKKESNYDADVHSTFSSEVNTEDGVSDYYTESEEGGEYDDDDLYSEEGTELEYRGVTGFDYPDEFGRFKFEFPENAVGDGEEEEKEFEGVEGFKFKVEEEEEEDEEEEIVGGMGRLKVEYD